MPLNQGRRTALRDVPSDRRPHRQLWLDRYLGLQTFAPERTPDGYDEAAARKARDALLDELARPDLPEGYRPAFDRWRTSLEASGRVAIAEATVRGRMVVGLGAKGPAEFGLALHRTWGLPIVPGSSLKGIAAWGADRRLRDPAWRRRDRAELARDGGPNAFDAVFGDVEEQGAVVFHDAWWKPGPGGVQRDVMTVHHPGYYQQETGGTQEPTDLDDPIPVGFLSVSGTFLVALELAPSLDPAEHGHWLEAAWVALALGLRDHGVGSKTNAGYGRVQLQAWSATSLASRWAEEARKRAEEAESAWIRAERDRRIALPDAAARVADVEAVEGVAALRAWLSGGPARTPTGLGEDDLGAAMLRLRDLGRADGLPAGSHGPYRQRLEAALVPPRVVAALRGLEPGELERRLTECTRKNTTDWTRLARLLAGQPLTEQARQEAAAWLERRGAKPGHLKPLREGPTNA